jgi:arsenite oxidase small subunit
MPKNMLNRRGFLKSCMTTASVIGASPTILASQVGSFTPYNKVLIKQNNGMPMNSHAFDKNKGLIIHYPYVTTPCFLIDLGKPIHGNSEPGQEPGSTWPGGVGHNKSIVAFSAICTHKLSYPTRTVSFINFRDEKISFRNNHDESETGTQLIHCCSERSVYDPSKGASVVGGPAPVALTVIVLEYDSVTDRLFATGTSGAEQYQRFFEKFSYRIKLDYQIEKIDLLAKDSSVAYPADTFSTNRIQC